MRSRSLAIGVGAITLVLLFGVVAYWRALPGGEGHRHVPPEGTGEKPEIDSELVAERFLLLEGVSRDDAMSLSREVTSLLRAYESDKPDDYIALLDRWGLDTSTFWSENPEQWNASTFVVRNAEMRPSQASIVPLMGGGYVPARKGLPPDATTQGVATYTTIVDASRGPRDVVGGAEKINHDVWIHFPAVLNTPDGGRSVGTISLRMSQRASDGQWLVTGSMLQNVSAGGGIGAPPVR